jgi:methyl-accepting chemotaxis protein
VQQLEKVTQQNAAMVEEATAASASLEEQADALTRAVGSFKLAEDGRAAAPASRPAHVAAAAAPAPKQEPRATALPKHEARPAVAELPRGRETKRTDGKPDAAKEEGWEEF